MGKRKPEDGQDEDEGPARAAPGFGAGPFASFGAAASTSAGPGEQRKDKFTLHLKALNQQFAKWVADQAEGHAGELWKDGVKDYLKHADKLVTDFADVLAEKGSPAPTPSVVSFGSGPTKPTGDGDAPKAPAPTSPTTSSLFGSAAAPAAASSPPAAFSFGGAPSSTPGLFGGGAASFGTPPSLFGAAAPPSLFGAPGHTPGPAKAGGIFGFPTDQPPAVAPKEEDDGGDGGDGGDDAERESSPGLKDDDSEKPYEIMWSCKSKLFTNKSGTWVDTGKGTLSVRKMKEGSGPAYLVFLNDAGRVLTNATLYKGISPVAGKSPKMMTIALFVADENQKGKTERQVVLFQFGRPDIASAFKDNVEKHAPQ